MKKLKKSLLVVPALGVLMLAAAGSVGGTVAWFSSVNTFNTAISSFSVGRVNGNLSVEMTAGRGTKKVGDAIVVGAADGNVKMTHGSFKHTVETVGDGSVYTVTNQSVARLTGEHNEGGTYTGVVAIDAAKFLLASKQIAGTYTFTFKDAETDYYSMEGTTSITAVANIALGDLSDVWGLTCTGAHTPDDTIKIALTNTYALDTDWMYSTAKIDSNYWYYAVSWNMTFTYDFGSDPNPRKVYFDVSNSHADPTVGTAAQGGASEKTQKGFRLAFHNKTTRNLIWAPLQDQPSDIHYVTDINAIGSYANNATEHLIYSGLENNKLVASGSASVNPGENVGMNYICTLAPDDGNAGNGIENVVDINCVAWFEGTDPNVINRAEMNNIAASLSFFATV